MVEVLQRGRKPEDRTYVATCSHCSSLLRFKASEAQIHFDQRDGDYVSVACPECQHEVTASMSNYLEKNIGGGFVGPTIKRT